MSRAIIVGCSALLGLGFAWPSDYAEQSSADVATCVAYTRQLSPGFDARVSAVDLETGQVDIERGPSDALGEVAFSRCLLSVRHWRLIERNLPKVTEPARLDPATMASRSPDTLTR